MDRVQRQYILKDLEKKMVFIAGPRQAGKTWLAQSIAKNFENAIYLNFDLYDHRQIIINNAWPATTELLVLDELHKMPLWKNYLKGIYDTKPAHLKIIVTGSARLDIMRQVGDSLAGRFFLHRLLPLSVAELHQLNHFASLDHLVNYGNFPEPFFAETIDEANRWRLQYTDSLLRNDVLEFDNIQNLKNIQLVFELLRNRVGSPISFTSLAEDIGISVNTVKKYIQILESLYIIFRVTPYSKNIARSLIKAPKIYFFDNGLIKGNTGIQFENLVANCLLKSLYAKTDYQGKRYELKYLRTKDQLEVDFAVCCEDEIIEIIEAKVSNNNIGKGLKAFHEKYQFPAIQVVKDLQTEHMFGKIHIVSAEKFLKNLFL